MAKQNPQMDKTDLALWTKRLIRLINTGAVKGNRLYDLQQSDSYRIVNDILKNQKS